MNAKERAFVSEYLVDRNATQAAIRAGYSARTAKQQGSRLLTKVDVQEAIAAQEDAHRERCAVSVESLSDMLQADRDLAHKLGQAGAAVSATMGLAKLHGLIIDKKKVETSFRSASELTDAELMAVVAGHPLET